MECDISKQQSIESFFNAFKDQFGTCDILLNNAGMAYKGSIFNKDVVQETFQTNFFGTVTICEMFLPIVKKKIINCTSMAGRFHGITNEDLFKQLNSLKHPQELQPFYDEFLKRVEEGTNEQYGWTSQGYGKSKLFLNLFGRLWANTEEVK